MKMEIDKKINFVSLSLKELAEFIKEYEEASKNNETIQKRRLLLMIKRIAEEITETVIKINMIILKEKGCFPKSYKQSFTKLSNYYNIEKELINELAQTAIFRNELAHEYIDMNEKYAIENSKKILKFYPKFLLLIQS